ncbi:MAG: hypothetical protein BMS9Abin02_1500 [Anaerolineae bacterium]|nr:MAG: hypothetical protein BMS9Abin02_1500 [Anaerolineae bacterium]
MKTQAKILVKRLGMEEALKKFYVEGRMLGERSKFLIRGRPNPSDAILLAGSGRSGTTWIGNLIASGQGIQQIFEPLHPRFSVQIRHLTGWEVGQRPRYQAHYMRSDEPHGEWSIYLNEVLSGRERNYWTDYHRTSYFPERFLIKTIRANLMLGFLSDQFSPKIIYVYRHPCAVVLSRLKVRWRADVGDILSQDKLVEDYLQPWIGAIGRERDLLGAHAVWWAVENMVASRELESRPHYAVTYEALVQQPRLEIRKIWSWLGIQPIPIQKGLIERPAA